MMIPSGKEGIIVGGTVNWFANSNVNTRTQAIVSLHLGKESYQEISQPDYGMPSNLTLGIMKDCLCVFSRSDSLIDVWLMKEYGNKESWIKLIHLPFSSPLVFIVRILRWYTFMRMTTMCCSCLESFLHL